MPSTNTAGWLASRAGEMPSAVAVLVSIIATCWLVSFSYLLSGAPATIVGPIACTAPGEAASRLTVADAVAESASEPVKWVPCGGETGHCTIPATASAVAARAVSREAGRPVRDLRMIDPDSLGQHPVADRDRP